MSTRERIIVALVSAIAIALGGAMILHMSGSSSNEEETAVPAAVNAPPPAPENDAPAAS